MPETLEKNIDRSGAQMSVVQLCVAQMSGVQMSPRSTGGQPRAELAKKFGQLEKGGKFHGTAVTLGW